MSSQNFVGNVLAGFTDAFRPLEDSLTSIDDFAALLSSFGWTLDPGGDFSQITSALRPVADALTAVDNAVQALRALGPDPTAEQIAGVIPPLTDAIKALVSAIRALATGPGFTLPPPTPLDKPEFWATFAQELLEWLLYMYVKDHQRVLFGILHFLGVLTEEEEYPAVPFRHNYLRRGVRWDRIPKIVTSPQGLFADVYGWGVAFDHPAFIGNLAKLLAAFELSVQVAPAPGDLLDIYYDPGVPARGSLLLLSGPVYSAAMTAGSALGYVEGDLGVMPIPPSGSRTQDPAGFSLFPIISGQLGETIHIVDGLDLSLKGGFESDAAVRVEIRPDGVNVVVSPSLGAKIDAHASLQAQPSKPWILIGAEGSTRLELSSAHVGLSAAGPVGNIEYIIEVGADKAALVIDFGEGDGFLQQMLGGKPQSLDLGVVAGWSSKSGLRFSGQAQLEANIPVHLSIAGVLAVDTIYIKFRAGTDAKTATLEISAAGGLTLGPVAATVDRVGLAINCRAVDPKTDPPGNLGDLNLGFGFKAPNGLGLLIDTGAVVGGGYIFCDPEKGQYTGVLELSAEALQIKVIGILNTVLPGGQTGFSLLLIVSAEFEPIQLGFGFTLSGVGGLAGVNRTMVLDALRTGLKNHTLNSILFPKDPIVHAQQIISDLQTVFPPQQNRYVFGPMLEIGWGVPTIILAELGIVLELPAPVRLAILGQMTAVLPEENAAIVLIHLDVLGTVDFEKKFLTIDATLYDSRVTVYTLLGDMALRMIWGENANFALSVGGLNPRFQPPAGFPSLKRLTLSLGSGANPRAGGSEPQGRPSRRSRPTCGRRRRRAAGSA